MTTREQYSHIECDKEISRIRAQLAAAQAENERLKQVRDLYTKEMTDAVRADQAKKTAEEIADMAYNRGLYTFGDEIRCKFISPPNS